MEFKTYSELKFTFLFQSFRSFCTIIVYLSVSLLTYSQAQKVDESFNLEHSFLEPMSINWYIEKIQSCLILVTNNKKQDIPFLKVPVVLRFVDFSQFDKLPKLKKHSNKSLTEKPDLFYLPKSDPQLLLDIVGNVYNVSGKLSPKLDDRYHYNKLFKCNTSSLLYGGPEYESRIYGMCSKIDVVRFSSHTRSWKCEAFLDILPHTKHYSNETLINYWHWEEPGDRVKPLHFRCSKYVPYLMTDISVPRINILMHPFVKDFKSSELVTSWFDTVIYKNKRYMENLDLFLIIRTYLYRHLMHCSISTAQ